MPTIQSADLWRESGRYDAYGKEMLRITRPARARHAVRPDQRGDDHRHLPRLRPLLQGPAAQPLPHPVEVPRRGPAALRRHALARVPDEGRLFLRPRPGRRAPFLQQDVRRLPAHFRAPGPAIDPDARRYRPDRRRSQPRVHHPGLDRRERGVLPRGLSRLRGARRRHRFRRRRRAAARSSTNGPRSTPRPPRCTTRRPSRRSRAEKRMSARGIEVGHIFYFGTKYSEPMGAKRHGSGRPGARRSIWAPTASARRASSRRSSRRATTTTASSGRSRSRPSTRRS